MKLMKDELKKTNATYGVYLTSALEEAVIQLSSLLYPTLYSLIGDLLYQFNDISTAMKLEAFKTFIGSLATKAKELNDKIKDYKVTDCKHMRTDFQFIFKDLTILSSLVITSQQHANHLTLQATFLTESTELVRRELTTIEAVVSNELNEAKRIRIICFQLLPYLIEQLNTRIMKIEKAEPFENSNPEADGSDLSPIAKFSQTKLPGLFLNAILDEHACRCAQCESEVLKAMLDQAK